MNPSHDDPAYQIGRAVRRAFNEFDIIGMDYFYAYQQVQCPSDDDMAFTILRPARYRAPRADPVVAG